MTCTEFRALGARVAIPTKAEIIAVVTHFESCVECHKYAEQELEKMKARMTESEIEKATAWVESHCQKALEQKEFDKEL